MSILYSKLILCGGLGLLAMLLFWQRSLITATFHKHSAPYLLIFWLIFRFFPFLVIYIFLQQIPQSDLLNFFYPLGQVLAKGGIPFRDIESAYSPLFGYWMALPVIFWDDPRAVLLLLLLAEGIMVWLTYRFYSPNEPTEQRLFRALFYYVLPTPFAMSILSSQEDLLMWGFSAWAMLYLPKKPYSSGLLTGFALLSTKAILVFVVVPMFFMSRNKIAYVLGIVTLCVPITLLLIWKTQWAWITQPLGEGVFIKAPNWRSLLSPILPDSILMANSLWKWGGIVVLTGLTIELTRLAIVRPWQQVLPLFFIALYSMMSVVQQNAISTYAFIFMLPLVFTMLDFRRPWYVSGLVGFNVLAAIHPSLWWRLGQPFYNSFADLAKPTAMLEYTIEVVIVFGFIYYALEAINILRRLNTTTETKAYAV